MSSNNLIIKIFAFICTTIAKIGNDKILFSQFTDPIDLDDKIREIREVYYQNPLIQKYNERMMEYSIIEPILETLNYFPFPGAKFTRDGETFQVDYVIFNNENDLDCFMKGTKSVKDIGIIVESKKSKDGPLKPNFEYAFYDPCKQIIEYLQKSEGSYGFLTNGKIWTLVKNTKIGEPRQYIQFDLFDAILSNSSDGLDCLKLFIKLFQVLSSNKNDLRQALLNVAVIPKSDHFKGE